jgi:hypothetical protein
MNKEIFASSPVSRLPSSGLLSLVLVVHLLCLALVLGPPVFFGAVVAPQAFHLLPTRDMAGALQAPIVTRLCWIAEGSFAALLLTSWFLTRKGASKIVRVVMTRAAFLGLIVAVVIEKLLVARIERIRVEAAGLIDTLPAADPSRLLLEQLHRVSTAFFGVEIVAAVLVLAATARLLSSHPSPPPVAPLPGAARPPVPKVLDLSGV